MVKQPAEKHDIFRKIRKVKIKTGYTRTASAFNRWFNLFFAIFFIIISSPLMLLIAILIKLIDGKPVLYKGVRLGRTKKPFIMYKFRTLIPEAQQIIGAELLTEQLSVKMKMRVGSAFGKLLRDTRVDELPQLFNIVKGDMDFIGPRPERPEIYEKLCKNIKGYDKRFIVRPGLIGYSQLFTPHSTPKEIRMHIDNLYLARKHNLVWDFVIIIYTMLVVLGKMFYLGARFLWRNVLLVKLLGFFSEKRRFERVPLENSRIQIAKRTEGKWDFTHEAMLVNINEEAMLVYDKTFDYDSLVIRMETVHSYITRHCNNVKRKKTAICYGTIYRRYELDGNDYDFAYVIKYTPMSPFNMYMIHQYFLKKSMI
ncbi:MAG: sugar transferase [Nitrospirota bacterium]